MSRTHATAAHLNDLPGKTVATVESSQTDGAYGPEPMTVLTFTDGTWHGFVHPTDGT